MDNADRIKQAAEQLKGSGSALAGMLKGANELLNSTITPGVEAQLPNDIKDLLKRSREVTHSNNPNIDFSEQARKAQDLLRDVNNVNTFYNK